MTVLLVNRSIIAFGSSVGKHIWRICETRNPLLIKATYSYWRIFHALWWILVPLLRYRVSWSDVAIWNRNWWSPCITFLSPTFALSISARFSMLHVQNQLLAKQSWKTCLIVFTLRLHNTQQISLSTILMKSGGLRQLFENLHSKTEPTARHG